ncbi:MAG: hypothetical protein D6800_07765, partial [Candidatus Zixiibacteriota bacterium]
MTGLYRLFARVVYALVFPYAGWRAHSGDALWQGRLGKLKDAQERAVWVHAASVGETRIMSYLVTRLLRRQPELDIHVTVMTRAGYATAKSLMGDKCRISFFPLDAPLSMRRFLDILRPRLIVIAETEIWPTLITEASRRNIPVILVNGRMSERTFRRYRLLRRAVGRLLSTYDQLFLKSDADRERYRAFGVPENKMTVAGDMKFDAPLPARSLGRVRELRYRFGLPENAFVWVAGSTRTGEEQQLLALFKRLADKHPLLHLVLAPRHVERAGEIRVLLESIDVDYRVYGESARDELSDNKGNTPRVLLIDRMGLLNDLYLCAEAAFVGGT